MRSQSPTAGPTRFDRRKPDEQDIAPGVLQFRPIESKYPFKAAVQYQPADDTLGFALTVIQNTRQNGRTEQVMDPGNFTRWTPRPGGGGGAR